MKKWDPARGTLLARELGSLLEQVWPVCMPMRANKKSLATPSESSRRRAPNDYRQHMRKACSHALLAEEFGCLLEQVAPMVQLGQLEPRRHRLRTRQYGTRPIDGACTRSCGTTGPCMREVDAGGPLFWVNGAARCGQPIALPTQTFTVASPRSEMRAGPDDRNTVWQAKATARRSKSVALAATRYLCWSCVVRVVSPELSF